ncbi:hypothetical protein C6A86_016805 [Mycobacterium sp. ITM-2016-00316]|uniref:hypothetical protein n=1 Tax=Mycobacterium sp. ITM-2016-00316 TaxID=2099695 RepID=UPI00287FE8EF|nr:hypothetical protein [Mycobacterium sp. ITM-2016-00316]WNG79929.1 hypothetical protein C6A86_016805 [Mycobacterium sp. ITM-2016-00316]
MRQGASKPFELFYAGDEASVLVGTIETRTQRADVAAIVIDGQPIIGYRFEDGQCLLQMNLYNESNQLVLQVVDNELIYGTTSWDIEFVGNTLTVRNGLGDIYVEIRFRVPRQVYIPRGRLFYNGVELEIWSDGVAIVNNGTVLSRVSVVGMQAALLIGEDAGQLTTAIWISDVPREFDRAVARASIAKKKLETKQVRTTLGTAISSDASG